MYGERLREASIKSGRERTISRATEGRDYAQEDRSAGPNGKGGKVPFDSGSNGSSAFARAGIKKAVAAWRMGVEG